MVDRIIQSFLVTLGLTAEEIQIYSSLVEKGDQTILELARQTKIPRTNVYRTLESMKAKGVTEEIIDEYKTKAKAVTSDTLEFLVGKKEIEVKNLRDQLPTVISALDFTAGSNFPDTKVLFFRGKSGIQQMVWNTLRAKDEVIGYSYRILTDAVGEKFAIKWNEEFNSSGLKGRDLYSDEWLKSKVNPDSQEPGSWINFESRYIPSEVLNINHQMDIYNDTIGIYNWHQGEVFGVEIHNQKIADFQKQIFEILWNLPEVQPAP